MSDWDVCAFDHVKSLGADCIWFTGIPRHASGEPYVKGNPGSPYAVIDWFDINPYLADNEDDRLTEFKQLISRAHKAGLKCITDFIPNHVAWGYQGAIGTHDYCDGDWTDTRKVDYSNPCTVPAMCSILDFWASMGVDGFRCDMVELVPAEAMKEIIDDAKSKHPDLLFIAEAYNKDSYRMYLDYVGFDLLYDKSGVYDTLRSILQHGCSSRALTWNWQSLADMQPRMLNFLENHDEQRIASPYFAGSVARTWAAVAMTMLFNTASCMIYFGQEVGESALEGAEGRTSIFNWCSPTAVSRLCDYIYDGRNLPDEDSRILERYREIMALSRRGVFDRGRNWDLCYCNGNSQGFDSDHHFAFIRYDDSGEAWLVFCNFCNNEAKDVIITIPEELRYLTSSDHVTVSAAPLDFSITSLYSI